MKTTSSATPTLTVIAVSMVLPLVVIAGISVNERKFISFPPKGFSLKWYVEIFDDKAWFSALQASVVVALLAAILAVSIAVPIAYGLWRYRLSYMKALYSLGHHALRAAAGDHGAWLPDLSSPPPDFLASRSTW